VALLGDNGGWKEGGMQTECFLNENYITEMAMSMWGLGSSDLTLMAPL